MIDLLILKLTKIKESLSESQIAAGFKEDLDSAIEFLMTIETPNRTYNERSHQYRCGLCGNRVSIRHVYCKCCGQRLQSDADYTRFILKSVYTPEQIENYIRENELI